MKAYENIEHLELVKQATRLKCELNWLRWLLRTFTMPRVIQCLEALVGPVKATRTVVPGSSAADLLMRIVIDSPVQDLRHHFRAALQVAVVVDDVQVVVHGPSGQTHKVAEEVVAFFTKRLGEARLPVAARKLVITASSPGVACN